MGFMCLKKFTILILLISAASLLSTSFAAGRQSKFFNKLAKEAIDATPEEVLGKPLSHKEAARIHERLLRVNTKDYGRYDPAPALVKPPFKLIQN
ncbi:protein CASPARIAN STRIP INTEGRITY FACTOR 1-like [Argentina anserina]|uniref:protein CASPARIAN STRIP INTEGRITY FACTOR 1-like n=1 Tax=Argentina anserina TaxID=57926 RepID=UPI0021763F70|nr:protein CASPARIAN STRIP INTEGRITY FACTOR 1-like [Potentilla anserina]